MMGRKLKNMENETQRVYDMVHGEKHWKYTEKHGKWEVLTAELGIWQKKKIVKNVEWEMHTVGLGIW